MSITAYFCPLLKANPVDFECDAYTIRAFLGVLALFVASVFIEPIRRLSNVCYAFFPHPEV